MGARYCAILNAVNYISTILGDWGDNVVCEVLEKNCFFLITFIHVFLRDKWDKTIASRSSWSVPVNIFGSGHGWGKWGRIVSMLLH